MKQKVIVEKQAVQQAEKQEYTLEKLRDNCIELFGITTTTFAGATAALPEKGMYTVAEIKGAINKWFNKEAK